MSEPIQLIVGLGNPGPEYAGTRHNAGAIFLDALAELHCCELKPEKKFLGYYGKATISQQSVHLLFPTTFMNRSGQSVIALSQFFRIPLENILVIHDDLDLPMGTLRLKKGGGHGGNNGLRDIIEKFGGKNDFARLRLGIGHPGEASKVTGHVLGQLDKAEQQILTQMINEAIHWLPDILRGDWSKAMNHLHRFKADQA